MLILFFFFSFFNAWSVSVRLRSPPSVSVFCICLCLCLSNRTSSTTHDQRVGLELGLGLAIQMSSLCLYICLLSVYTYVCSLCSVGVELLVLARYKISSYLSHFVFSFFPFVSLSLFLSFLLLLSALSILCNHLGVYAR